MNMATSSFENSVKDSILFTHSYFLRFDPKQWKTGQPYAPLGTLYAAAVMRDKGYPVSFHDVQFAHGPSEIEISLASHPKYFVIYDDGFNYLTKMCLTNMRKAAFEMIGLAKAKDSTVIISSSDSSDHYEKYLNAGADFILIGEAEQTLLELIKALDTDEQNLSLIDGIAYKDNDAIVKTKRREVIKDLDSLPLPAWDLIDIEPYKKMWQKTAGYFSLNMGTTRGCPYKCNWCAKPIYGNRYNARSAQNVVNEIKYLKEKFCFDHIWFCDDIFGLKPGWVTEFADVVIKENLHFKFKIQSRADLLTDERYVQALAKAGCDTVWMGAESGSQKILDAMDKGVTTDQIRIATKLLKKNNIKPCFFIQFGYLGETKEDISATIKMITTLLPYEIGISVSYPLPGTKFYDKVKDQLQQKANWTDSDELALMFRNTYQPAFYKQLHRYVHKTYHKHLAFESLNRIVQKPSNTNFRLFKKAFSGIYYIPSAFIDKIKLARLEFRHE